MELRTGVFVMSIARVADGTMKAAVFLIQRAPRDGGGMSRSTCY